MGAFMRIFGITLDGRRVELQPDIMCNSDGSQFVRLELIHDCIGWDFTNDVHVQLFNLRIRQKLVHSEAEQARIR